MVSQTIRREQAPARVFVIMSDQPDCCGDCGSRLEIIDETRIDGERVFVGYCGRCIALTLLVDEE